MISRIQFGGITRRPSDLSAKEGACEESLNVTHDVNEVAPVIEPDDRTSELVGDTSAVESNTSDRYIYIHKTGAYENYIALDDSTNSVYAYCSGVKSSALVNLTSLSETYRDITSIGNTLIVSTDKNLHYILFKDGQYVYLGTKIPEPMVDFRAVPIAGGEGESLYTETHSKTEVMLTGNAVFQILWAVVDSPMSTKDAWNQVAANYGVEENDGDDVDATKAIDIISKYIWDRYFVMKQTNLNKSVFSSAVFVRSALKMYDGSYIYQSVPVLLHCGGNTSMDAYPIETTEGGVAVAGLGVALRNVYKAKAIVTYPGLGNWSDIVRSVDIFVSTDICNPKLNARIDGAISAYSGTWFKFLGQSNDQEYNEINDLREEILSKVNFYLIESKNVEDIGSGATLNLTPVAQDDLLVKQTLADDNLSHHVTGSVNGVAAYNSRLVLKGLGTRLYSGHPFLQGMVFKDSKTGVFANDVMEFQYFIRTEDGQSYSVIGRNSLGQQQFTYPTETVGSTTYYGLPCGFLYYPDPRCYKCDIYYGSASSPAYVYSVPMKEHPGLNGAYALCDLRNPVSSLATQDTSVYSYPASENASFSEDNRLVMSEAMNPFAFMLTNRQTFTDSILAVATTTRALSTGQFGQFPLYVFTDGGIWAVPITDTGSMSSAVPLSRDVALSADSVTPIDQAIVFVTKKGVMLLTGSDINELSPEMDGRHYAVDPAALTVLSDSVWAGYIGILVDRTPFIDFMKDARAVYDYANRRLIFFNDRNSTLQSYQYIYKMDTQSWHKMSLLQTGLGYANVLNGYPEALICAVNGGGVYRVCDLAVKYNPAATQQNTLSQVVITRPFNFNLAYVSKTLKRLFVKGRFEKGNVKYILLGSRDGENYHVIHSLRGPSNSTFFRVIMLGTLAPEERVSYIEMDYEARFTDKGR